MIPTAVDRDSRSGVFPTVVDLYALVDGGQRCKPGSNERIIHVVSQVLVCCCMSVLHVEPMFISLPVDIQHTLCPCGRNTSSAVTNAAAQQRYLPLHCSTAFTLNRPCCLPFSIYFIIFPLRRIWYGRIQYGDIVYS